MASRKPKSPPWKVALTDKFIGALKVRDRKERDQVQDTVVSKLYVRVTASGVKTFAVAALLQGDGAKKSTHFVTLGHYPALALKAAREKAGPALALMAEGKHPKHEAKKVQDDKFSTAVDDFLAHLRKKGLRTVSHTESALRRDFLGQVRSGKDWNDGPDPVWRNRPLTQITRSDIIKRLEKIEEKWAKQGKQGKHPARHALASVRRLFNWAFDRERITTLPTLRLSDNNTLGITQRSLRRKRVLGDDEIRDIWVASGEIGYPFGPLVKVLLLTGQRRSDWQLARGEEIDRKHDVLTVPPDRFKMGVAHECPYSPKVAEILADLPTADTTGPLFTLDGREPVKGIHHQRAKLDKRVNERRAERGEGPIKHWVLHDLRRTCRTRLSDLEVDTTIAELVIGHAQPGLHETYNLSSHRKQKRDALQRWEQLLMMIVSDGPTTPDNVIRLRA
jgi:integrase